MAIRKMEISDIPAVLSIQHELQFLDWNERQFAIEIKASYASCLVYEYDAGTTDQHGPQIMGYAIFHILGPDSELLCIATSKDHQRKGVGKNLLNAGLDQLDFQNGDCCFLEVRQGNSKARDFYEKNGFKPYGLRKNYYSDGENAMIYKRFGESTREV